MSENLVELGCDRCGGQFSNRDDWLERGGGNDMDVDLEGGATQVCATCLTDSEREDARDWEENALIYFQAAFARGDDNMPGIDAIHHAQRLAHLAG